MLKSAKVFTPGFSHTNYDLPLQKLVELPSTQTSYISQLADLPNLETLSLSWVGLFGSFNWKYDFLQFLVKYKHAQFNRLKNIKLCQAALILNDAMISLLPPKLDRLVISNMNRSDPSFINAKHVDHGTPIKPEYLSLIIDQCPRLRLFLINPTGKAIQLRMAAKSIKESVLKS